VASLQQQARRQKPKVEAHVCSTVVQPTVHPSAYRWWSGAWPCQPCRDTPRPSRHFVRWPFP